MIKFLSFIFFVTLVRAQPLLQDEVSETPAYCPEAYYELIAGQHMDAGAVYCSQGVYFMNCRVAMKQGWVGKYIHASISYEALPSYFTSPGQYPYHFDIDDDTKEVTFSFPRPEPKTEEGCEEKTLYIMIHMDTVGPGGAETAYARSPRGEHVAFTQKWGWSLAVNIGCGYCVPTDPAGEFPPASEPERCIDCLDQTPCPMSQFRLFCGPENVIAGTGFVNFDTKGCVDLSFTLNDKESDWAGASVYVANSAALSSDGPWTHSLLPTFSRVGFGPKTFCSAGESDTLFQNVACGESVHVAVKVAGRNIALPDGSRSDMTCYLGDGETTSLASQWGSPGITLKDVTRCCSASGSVADTTVSVATGCTYTIGYWKNHYAGARNPKQNRPWPLGAAETSTCGKTWMSILETPSNGDAWYIMAKQFIGASLNVAGGATPTKEVADALPLAEKALKDFCPSATGYVRDQFISWGKLFDQFNNGLIGPGHCSDGATIDPCPCRLVIDGATDTVTSTDQSSSTLKNNGKGPRKKRFLFEHVDPIQVKLVRTAGDVTVEVTNLVTLASQFLTLESSFILDGHADARITVSGSGSATFLYCKVGEVCEETRTLPPGQFLVTPSSSSSFSASVVVLLFALVFSLF